MNSNPKQIRRLRRFFSSYPIPEAGATISLHPKEARHMRTILRLQPGDACLVTDGSGSEAEARILAYEKSGGVQVRIEKRHSPAKSDVQEGVLPVKMYVAVPQRGKMDGLIEKLEELGVAEIVPLETSRTVVKIASEAQSRLLNRWNRIAKEAAKQSGALELIKIHAPLPIRRAFQSFSGKEEVAVFHPCSDSEGMKFSNWAGEMKGRRSENAGFIHLFVGPEGGWTQEEVQMALDKNASIVSLGKTILKVDTAAIAVASALKLLDL